MLELANYKKQVHEAVMAFWGNREKTRQKQAEAGVLDQREFLQIAIYGDLLTAVQGRSANHGALMLGTGEADSPFQIESFRLDDVRYYVRRAARRLEAFAADLPVDLEPEPCAYCGKCEWSVVCDARWEAADHLCRLADITKKQIRRLAGAGVSTLSMLACLDGVRVSGIAPLP